MSVEGTASPDGLPFSGAFPSSPAPPKRSIPRYTDNLPLISTSDGQSQRFSALISPPLHYERPGALEFSCLDAAAESSLPRSAPALIQLTYPIANFSNSDPKSDSDAGVKRFDAVELKKASDRARLYLVRAVGESPEIQVWKTYTIPHDVLEIQRTYGIDFEDAAMLQQQLFASLDSEVRALKHIRGQRPPSIIDVIDFVVHTNRAKSTPKTATVANTHSGGDSQAVKGPSGDAPNGSKSAYTELSIRLPYAAGGDLQAWLASATALACSKAGMGTSSKTGASGHAWGKSRTGMSRIEAGRDTTSMGIALRPALHILKQILLALSFLHNADETAAFPRDVCLSNCLVVEPAPNLDTRLPADPVEYRRLMGSVAAAEATKEPLKCMTSDVQLIIDDQGSAVVDIPYIRIKVCDFNASARPFNDRVRKGADGIDNLAPEYRRGARCGGVATPDKADVWSAGLLLVQLLGVLSPDELLSYSHVWTDPHAPRHDFKGTILQCQLEDRISSRYHNDQLTELVRHMLHYDLTERYSAIEALRHSAFSCLNVQNPLRWEASFYESYHFTPASGHGDEYTLHFPFWLLDGDAASTRGSTTEIQLFEVYNVRKRKVYGHNSLTTSTQRDTADKMMWVYSLLDVPGPIQKLQQLALVLMAARCNSLLSSPGRDHARQNGREKVLPARSLSEHECAIAIEALLDGLPVRASLDELPVSTSQNCGEKEVPARLRPLPQQKCATVNVEAFLDEPLTGSTGSVAMIMEANRPMSLPSFLEAIVHRDIPESKQILNIRVSDVIGRSVVRQLLRMRDQLDSDATLAAGEVKAARSHGSIMPASIVVLGNPADFKAVPIDPMVIGPYDSIAAEYLHVQVLPVSNEFQTTFPEELLVVKMIDFGYYYVHSAIDAWRHGLDWQRAACFSYMSPERYVRTFGSGSYNTFAAPTANSKSAALLVHHLFAAARGEIVSVEARVLHYAANADDKEAFWAHVLRRLIAPGADDIGELVPYIQALSASFDMMKNSKVDLRAVVTHRIDGEHGPTVLSALASALCWEGLLMISGLLEPQDFFQLVWQGSNYKTLFDCMHEASSHYLERRMDSERFRRFTVCLKLISPDTWWAYQLQDQHRISTAILDLSNKFVPEAINPGKHLEFHEGLALTREDREYLEKACQACRMADMKIGAMHFNPALQYWMLAQCIAFEEMNNGPSYGHQLDRLKGHLPSAPLSNSSGVLSEGATAFSEDQPLVQALRETIQQNCLRTTARWTLAHFFSIDARADVPAAPLPSLPPADAFPSVATLVHNIITGSAVDDDTFAIGMVMAWLLLGTAVVEGGLWAVPINGEVCRRSFAQDVKGGCLLSESTKKMIANSIGEPATEVLYNLLSRALDQPKDHCDFPYFRSKEIRKCDPLQTTTWLKRPAFQILMVAPMLNFGFDGAPSTTAEQLRTPKLFSPMDELLSILKNESKFFVQVVRLSTLIAVQDSGDDFEAARAMHQACTADANSKLSTVEERLCIALRGISTIIVAACSKNYHFALLCRKVGFEGDILCVLDTKDTADTPYMKAFGFTEAFLTSSPAAEIATVVYRLLPQKSKQVAMPALIGPFPKLGIVSP